MTTGLGFVIVNMAVLVSLSLWNTLISIDFYLFFNDSEHYFQCFCFLVIYIFVRIHHYTIPSITFITIYFYIKIMGVDVSEMQNVRLQYNILNKDIM